MMRTSATAQPAEAASGERSGLLAVEALARAARQVALYGPDHPIADSALHEAWRELSSEANRVETELRVDESGLRWNRSPLVGGSNHVGRLHQALRDRMVAVLKFRAALEVAELTRLLQVLAEDPQLLLSSGGVMQAFGPEGGGGLLVEDLDFSRNVQECESAWIEVCQEIDPEAVEPLRRILETCLHLVRSTGEHRTLEEIRAASDDPVLFDGQDAASPTEAIATLIASLIQSAGEIAQHTGSTNLQRWQESILLQLEALGPHWSAFIFRAPVATSDGSPDVLARLTHQMSFERRIALVLDYPGSIVTERSEGLALLLQRLLSHTEESFALERALHERARSQGVPEQVYRNVVGMLMPDLTNQPRAESTARRMEGTLELPADPKVELADLFMTLEARKVRRSRVYMLLDILEEELNASQYASVVKALLEIIQQCARTGEAELLVPALTRLLQETADEGGQSTGRRAIAESALARSSGPVVIELLVRELDRRPSGQRRDLLELLGQLGDSGHAALLEVIRQAPEVDATEALSLLAERDAPSYPNLRHLLGELPPVDLERSLRTLLRLSPPQISVLLGVVVVRPDPAARLALVRAVQESKSSRGGEVLVRLLADPVADLRAAAAAVLGAQRVAEAAPGLGTLLARESEFGAGARVKEAAAQALGQIGGDEALPALGEFLLRGGLLARFVRPHARLAAVQALVQIGGPAARQRLEAGRRRASPRVRNACLEALEEMARQPRRETEEGDRVR